MHSNEHYRFDNFVAGSCNWFALTSLIKAAEKPGKIYNPLAIYGDEGMGKTHLMNAAGLYIREIFYTLREAQVLIEEWRLEYNTFRPHSSLKYRPPAPEAWLH